MTTDFAARLTLYKPLWAQTCLGVLFVLTRPQMTTSQMELLRPNLYQVRDREQKVKIVQLLGDSKIPFQVRICSFMHRDQPASSDLHFYRRLDMEAHQSYHGI